MIQFWEILVPTVSNEGKPFRTRYHKVWDKNVREITGGLTIMSPVKGQWLDKIKNDILYRERMIPVRIACTEEQINLISDHTAKYYNQKAVIFYLISDKVTIKNYEDKN